MTRFRFGIIMIGGHPSWARIVEHLQDGRAKHLVLKVYRGRGSFYSSSRSFVRDV